MRQAYDYWQDQPGNYLSGLAIEANTVLGRQGFQGATNPRRPCDSSGCFNHRQPVDEKFSLFTTSYRDCKAGTRSNSSSKTTTTTGHLSEEHLARNTTRQPGSRCRGRPHRTSQVSNCTRQDRREDSPVRLHGGELTLDHLPGLSINESTDRHWPGGHKFAFQQVTGQKAKKPTGGLSEHGTCGNLSKPAPDGRFTQGLA